MLVTNREGDIFSVGKQQERTSHGYNGAASEK
jgi:hypothetical protein